MKETSLVLKKSDIERIGNTVYSDEQSGNAVFCFDGDCGIGSIFLRNLLPLFDPSYKIIDKALIINDETNEVTCELITNMPFSILLDMTESDE